MRKIYFLAATLLALASCRERPGRPGPVNFTFAKISEFNVGGEGAAEISAFDPETDRLFVVNNSSGSTVDVFDFSNPSSIVPLSPIDILQFGGGVNSVAVKNGLLAIAVEADPKTNPGSVVIFETDDLSSPEAVVTVGALPDMVAFSPNGRYIVTADEGEPNDDYTIDPEGSVSIIDVFSGYQVTSLNFASFESQKSKLEQDGFRIFGPNASFAQDIEPEYVTIDAFSQTAWVTLQENNGIAKVDLRTKKITDIFPMGTKNHQLPGNEMDASDRDGIIGNLQNWPVLAYFMPDGIASYGLGSNTFLITANEGDTRDYEGFEEEERVKDLELDPVAFPDAAILQEDENLGRYTATITAGDTDGDGDFDEIYGIGARSFTIWNGRTGMMIRDYKDLEKDLLMARPSRYDDTRSDNKGVEPEAVEVGNIRGRNILFVGLERSDAVMVYELTGASSLRFLQVLDGTNMPGDTPHDAPEGLLFIPASDSPNGRPLLLVSSEGDGKITVYQN
ncbi:choice-of-anchor I family protein [Algoriphagus sp. oki45]|uniref:choice-of-anchor I family protein n=1 Tax=Algoriphagus sp. oki45 TaxID=3067294 RepID=UPI0027F3E4CF|nr:choice-of-anchor I family protein [Algoriphagus sp. oki45]